MKTFLSRPLHIALLLAALPFASTPAHADNPFKRIGAKAKQGLTKVKQVPRRIGNVIKKIGNDASEASAGTRAVQVSGTDHYPGPVPQYGDPYYYDTPSNRRLELSRRGPQPLPASPAFNRETATRSGYYTAARYQALPPRTYTPDVSAPAALGPVRTDLSVPNRIGGDGRNQEAPSPATSPATEDMMLEPSQAHPSNPSGTGSPAAPSGAADQTIPENAAVPSPPPTPAAPLPPRQDLPFGELVPGKTGFVYSPWSRESLVDVSGIPTGTKVRCPYTSKTFRVP